MGNRLTKNDENDYQIINQNIDEEIEQLKEKNSVLINFLYSRCINFFEGEIKTNNFTISGGWGTGKTALINKLEKLIQLKEPELNIKFIKINLWEFELFDENKLFIKLITNIIMQIKGKFNLKENFKEKALTFLTKLANAIDFSISTDYTFLKYFGLHLGISAKSLKEQFKKEIDIKDNIFNLIKEFESLISSINDAKIIIVFDDLDRVQENKIINILTAIKNFFFQTEGNNIFYLTALNEEYINSILKTGQNEKENYTQKIFLEENKFEVTNKIEFDISILIYNLEQEFKKSNNYNEKKYEIVKDTITFISLEFFYEINERNFRTIYNKLKFIENRDFVDAINKLEYEKIFDYIFLQYLKRKYILQWKQLQERLINRAYDFMSKSFPELKLQENPIHIDFILSKNRVLEKIKNMNSIWLNNFSRHNFGLTPTNKIYLVYYKNYYNNKISEFSLLDFAPFIVNNKNNLPIPIVEKNYNYFNYNDILPFLDSDFRVYIKAKIEYFFSIQKKPLNWNKDIKLFDQILDADGTY